MWSETRKRCMITLFALLVVALSQGKRLPAVYELEVLGDPGAEEYRFVRKDITEEATNEKSPKLEDSFLEQEKRAADQDSKNVAGAVIQEESLKAEDAFLGQEKRDVDEGSCSWINTMFGNALNCPSGKVATGVCVGGQNYKCDGTSWSRLKCCKVDPNDAPSSCETKKHRGFRTQNCPEWRPFITQLCDIDAGCGQEYMDTAYQCCKLKNYRVNERQCKWKYGSFGESISCGDNQVVTGRCGLRGRNPEGCSGGSKHGIRCCPIRKL